jgi:hypothetical protein
VAISVPCDEAFQSRWAKDGFYFQLRGATTSTTPFDAVGRLGRLCARYPNAFSVYINCFSREVGVSPAKQGRALHGLSTQLRHCRSIKASMVPGMKGLFWKLALPPRIVVHYDYIWLIDADLDVTDKRFSLGRLLRDMRDSNASIAQPRIRQASETLETRALAGGAGRNQGAGTPEGARSTDIHYLRASAPFPDNCSAVSVDAVEVMAPIFRRAAWHIVHNELLSALPNDLLARTDWGMTDTWCGVVRSFLARPACALLHESIVHLDEHMIERAGLDNLSYSKGPARAGKLKWYELRQQVLNTRVPGVTGTMESYYRSRFSRFYSPLRWTKSPKCIHSHRLPQCGVLRLSGYLCSSGGVSYQVNQAYSHEGSTADGRPFYRGMANRSVFLFYTWRCGETKHFGWGVFNRAPSRTEISNVNGERQACSAATFLPGSRHASVPTAGDPHNATWAQYCGPFPMAPKWSVRRYEPRMHRVEAAPLCQRPCPGERKLGRLLGPGRLWDTMYAQCPHTTWCNDC